VQVDSSSGEDDGRSARARFEHEVAFYAEPEDHVRMCLAFVEDGLERGEPVMVALAEERGEALRAALGTDADDVQFVDMRELGANPARIIPRWLEFLADHGDAGPMRGIGEPAWPGRTEVEYAEAALHEGLLNLAFEDALALRLLCPYDLTALPSEVLDEARRTHPTVHDEPHGGTGTFRGRERARRAFSAPLPVPAHAQRVDFGHDELSLVRGLAVRIAEASRLDREATEDLALAVHEVATNSILHGGVLGGLWFWEEPDAVVVEVRDSGFIDDPLVGRRVPDLMDETGRGVWIANQLCDLVQIRSSEAGTQVRLRMWTPPRQPAGR
jgi:anti-sigma regulatory factor (Ser/Thr protein kinase)